MWGWCPTPRRSSRRSSASCTRSARAAAPPSRLRLSNEPEFLEWRRHFAHRERRFFHRMFELKAIRRRRVLRELIVGDVRGELADFPSALADLTRMVCGMTYLSIAASPLDPLVPLLAGAGFRKVKRTIAFIVKPCAYEDLVTDASRWTLYRSDIDTW
jgi:hypothetical protein